MLLSDIHSRQPGKLRLWHHSDLGGLSAVRYIQNQQAALLLRARDEGLPMPAGAILLTPELAGVPRKMLGEPVANLAAEPQAIVDALDFVFTGI